MTGNLRQRSASNIQHPSVDEYDEAMRQVDPLYEIDVASASRFITSLNYLRNAREAIGLTQRDVAELMGTQQSAISELENGVCDPQMSTLRRYAAAIGKFTNIEFSDHLPMLQIATLVEVTLGGGTISFVAMAGNQETVQSWAQTWSTPEVDTPSLVVA